MATKARTTKATCGCTVELRRERGKASLVITASCATLTSLRDDHARKMIKAGPQSWGTARALSAVNDHINLVKSSAG